MTWDETTEEILKLKKLMLGLPDKTINKQLNPEYVKQMKPISDRAKELHYLRIQMNIDRK